MAVETTFAIIKPHAVKEGIAGKIITMIEDAGFDIKDMRKMHISKDLAEKFYHVHAEKPFFGELVGNMSAGPAIVLALSKENAIKAWRDLMGATNPEQADEGTIRKLFGKNISFNATHGSDAPETAAYELGLFF